MTDRKFKLTDKEKYSLSEKEELGKLCVKYKEEYDKKVEENNAVNYNERRKKHSKIVPREGYLARGVREYYSDLNGLKNDDPVMKKAVKLGKRCYGNQIASQCDIKKPPTKSKFRNPGGGRKVTAPEVREALYDLFIDIRGSLKARLPRSLFKAQAKVFYDNWWSQQSDEVKKQPPLVFSNKWIKGWMTEYKASLRKPNKRFQIKQSDREERVYEYIKNVWTVRKFFLDNFSVDPPVINGDQMPLHRNESASQKTLNIQGCDTYVKENYSLSRERVTAFTQASSDPSIKVLPEFVFRGKGTRTKLQPPPGIKYHWAPKGFLSFRANASNNIKLTKPIQPFHNKKFKKIRARRLQRPFNARSKISFVETRIYFGGNRRGCNRRHSNKRHRYSLTIKEEISRVGTRTHDYPA